MRTHDIVFIQEHWQLPSMISVFTDRIRNVVAHGTSAMNDDELLSGRPHGGVSIVWRSSMKICITPLPTTNPRICAIKGCLTSGEHLFLAVNVYMPTDCAENRNSYDEVLQEVSSLLEMEGGNQLILGGDWNTDFNRQTPRTRSLLNFMQRESLQNTRVHGNGDFTFENTFGHRSDIDHFLVSDNLSNGVRCSILHDASNFSDHAVVSVALPLQIDHCVPRDGPAKTQVKWDEATPEHKRAYQDLLTALINDPTRHDNANAIPASIDELTVMHDHIVSCCTEASMRTIPTRKSHRKHGLAGWNDHVRPHRETALFWNIIWKQCGRPATGSVACIRRKTRAEYHRAVKWVKVNKKLLQAEKMANAISNNRSRDLWKEVKKAYRSSNSLPSTVDAACDEESIANAFASKYKSLYNNVSFDNTEMQTMAEDLEIKINENTCQCSICMHHSTVSADDVTESIGRLNAGKRDGSGLFSTDHLLHGGESLHRALANLFTGIIRTGCTPVPMLDSMVIPIPKNCRKSLNDSKNYRGIALNSPLSKTFEVLLLMRYSDVFATSDMQFGFKRKCSTTNCTFVLQEIIQYYVQRDSSVWCMLLDASQAFDNVQYVCLFRRLMNKNICPKSCRVLLAMHTGQIVRVRWGGTTSSPFTVRNGVKQGGILSPVLFTLYMDRLLEALQRCRDGCYMGRKFTGAVAYADDVAILAPTRSAIRRMLTIAEDVGREIHIKFNPSKSQLLHFSPQNHPEVAAPIQFCDTLVPVSSEAIHLGHHIGHDRKTPPLLSAADLTRRANILIARFGHCTLSVKYKLFKAHCMAVYGSNLWNINHAEPFLCSWRKCIRRLLYLPKRTHCDLLPPLVHDFPPDVQLDLRLVRFLHSCSVSKNTIVQRCMREVVRGSRSPISDSVSILCYKHHFERDNLPPFLKTTFLPNPTAAAIRDFIFLKEQSGDQNLNVIIDHLATM